MILVMIQRDYFSLSNMTDLLPHEDDEKTLNNPNATELDLSIIEWEWVEQESKAPTRTATLKTLAASQKIDFKDPNFKILFLVWFFVIATIASSLLYGSTRAVIVPVAAKEPTYWNSVVVSLSVNLGAES